MLALAATALVVFVGAPWVYINVIREPAAESFLDEVTATSLAEMGDAPTTTVAESSPAADSVLTDAPAPGA